MSFELNLNFIFLWSNFLRLTFAQCLSVSNHKYYFTSARMSGLANNSVQKKRNSTQKSDMSVKKNVLDNNEVLSKKFSRERSLPTTKVRHIMECSPNSEGLRMTSEAIAAVSRAAEAFVELLTLGAQEKSTHNRVTYNDLSQFVHSKEELNFIQDILPNKQKFSEVSKQIRKSKR